MESKLRVSGGFFITLAALLLMMPLPWLLAAVVAAAFHEACHYLAIRACCAKGGELKLYAFAAHLPLPEMSRGRELLCALAGPMGGLCLLLLARLMPRVALCAAMQSVYNLLPIYPLDGGRALRSGLLLFLPPPKAMAVCGVTEALVKIAICLLGVYGCFWLKLGIFPLLLAALLLIRTK